MAWTKLLAAFLVAALGGLVSSFMSLAWKRRGRPSQGAALLEALLPGYDCGLCGREGCRAYAAAVDSGRADPSICAPGGAEVEESIRVLLAERQNDPRAERRKAVIRCGAGPGVATTAFEYDNREDCASAATLYGGPLSCKDGCLGFGSCASACPLRAIRSIDGRMAVDPERCTGCGACLDSCPKGLIAILPVERAWFVACSARTEPDRRLGYCKAACDACGECVRASVLGEFVIAEGIARASHVEDPLGAEIAAHCPQGAIRPTSSRKKGTDTPYGRSEPAV